MLEVTTDVKVVQSHRFSALKVKVFEDEALWLCLELYFLYSIIEEQRLVDFFGAPSFEYFRRQSAELWVR